MCADRFSRFQGKGGCDASAPYHALLRSFPVEEVDSIKAVGTCCEMFIATAKLTASKSSA